MSEELFRLIQYLLPGFLAAWIFYGLCAHKKPEQFERVVQALIFTVIVQAFAFMHVATQRIFADPPVEQIIEGILPSIYAVLVGVVFAWGANRDFPHRLLRRLRMTEQTSYPSEWFGVFSSYKSYVVLHLHDERRLYGWPKEWPQSSEGGHFFITQPAWLVDETKSIDGKLSTFERDVGEKGVEGILINAKDVKWVEVMQKG